MAALLMKKEKSSCLSSVNSLNIMCLSREGMDIGVLNLQYLPIITMSLKQNTVFNNIARRLIYRSLSYLCIQRLSNN